MSSKESWGSETLYQKQTKTLTKNPTSHISSLSLMEVRSSPDLPCTLMPAPLGAGGNSSTDFHL